ncbi:MAG TPA: acetyl-CoA carboxylase carboxyltransferase subunit alpha [Anaeromyxobacteraceae bacterium]|nr:acetyl-CoA carboxylase carboxyltransferase subunit alpha [Anaeromyxobacteraceae bacterium]
MSARTAYTTDFERPLIALESKIAELKQLSGGAAVDFTDEILRLEKKAKRLQQEIFSDLSRWQVVQLARHPNRPYFLDYLSQMFTDFFEVEGDRRFAADRSIVSGFARFDGEPVVVIGQQKGRNTKENMLRNFGMPRPEGYRKARRLYDLADRFRMPLITFIDTPGAYPGIGAEERGQAEAIAVNLEVMSSIGVPSISVVVGEGGSGGALALGVTSRILMLQYSTYSVISPESCSSILYRDATKAQKSAEALKLTAKDLAGFGIVDEVIPEAPGGAHRDPQRTGENIQAALRKHLAELKALSPEELVRQRYEKYRAMGAYAAADAR